MTASTLKIYRQAYDDLRRHAAAEYPNECCGVLLGRLDINGRVVMSAVACQNVMPNSRHNRYEISPKELVAVQRAAREHNQEILGFYHSHPEHSADWSQTDLAQAFWVGCSYVITSVFAGPVVGETASYLLDGKGEHQKDLHTEVIEVID